MALHGPIRYVSQDGRIAELVTWPAGYAPPPTIDFYDHQSDHRITFVIQPEQTPRAAGAVLAPRWYTVAQVAELLGYGESKVRRLIMEGELRSLKDGRNRRVMPEWVDEYIDRRAAREG